MIATIAAGMVIMGAASAGEMIAVMMSAEAAGADAARGKRPCQNIDTF